MKRTLRPLLMLAFGLLLAVGAGVHANGQGAPTPAPMALDGVAGERLAWHLAAEDAGVTDYWAPIAFDRTNFEEVRQQVGLRYISVDFDESYAYAEAASWALASYEADARTLLPVAFYQARKGLAEERGALAGAAIKLSPTDAFVIVGPAPKSAPEPERKALSLQERRSERKREQDRARALRAAWAAIDFSAADFDRVIGFVGRTFEPNETWQLKHAWVAASQGYLYALDPHSRLLAKGAWEESLDRTEDASFDGIGATLTVSPGSDYTVVESPLQGQPAVKAGLRAGDLILKVDGVDIKGVALPKVVSRIKGPRGTRVTLTVRRDGEPDPRDIEIERAHIEVKNVQGHLLPHHEDVGYIKVTGFVKTTDRMLGKVFRELEEQATHGRLRGLVLDLRHNSGGFLTQGIRVSDRFLDRGTIVSVKNRNAREDEVYRAHASATWDVPLVVIVNDGTASAAEIVASAIQDNGRGLVVGDRTFGKASVQTLYPPTLEQDDYYIKLTVARYYSPSGRTLQVTGVTPDVVVTPEFGGAMPLGFREEDLSGHLVPLDAGYTSANAVLAARASRCAADKGVTPRLHGADPHPAVRFDHQLMVAADLLECTIIEDTAAVAPKPSP